MKQYKAGKMVKFICENCQAVGIGTTETFTSMSWSICKLLGMNYLAGPFDARVVDGGDNDGVSVVMMIKESHIAIHAWHQHRAVRVVIDSCKDFEYEDIMKFFFIYLQPSNILVLEEEKWLNFESDHFYFY